MLRPEVSGRIAAIGFVDGQRVRRGQLLVQLDDTLQRAQLQQAQAQASIARTNLQRSRELLAQGFVSQSAVDQNAAALQVAEAQVALAQAQLARMKVLAPFDGTAGIRAWTSATTSRTAPTSSPSRTCRGCGSTSACPSATSAACGRARRWRWRGRAARQQLQGRVQALDSQVDADGRALLVRARVDNPGRAQARHVRAPRTVLGVRENALVVPEEALVPLGGRQFLFKVVDGPQGKKLAAPGGAQVGMRCRARSRSWTACPPGDVVVTPGRRGDARRQRAGARDRPQVPAAGTAAGRGGAAEGAGAPPRCRGVRTAPASAAVPRAPA
jgi:membrane fusion protein, multidrug efflux system